MNVKCILYAYFFYMICTCFGDRVIEKWIQNVFIEKFYFKLLENGLKIYLVFFVILIYSLYIF